MGTICNVPEGQTFTVNLLGEKSTGVRTLRIVENKGGVHIPHNGPSAKTGLPGSWDGKKAEAIKSNAKPGETGFGSTGKMGYFIGKFGTSLKLVEIPRIHSCVGMVVAAKSREKHGLDEFIAFQLYMACGISFLSFFNSEGDAIRI